MVDIIGPIPTTEPVFWFLIIFWLIVFLLTTIFYKLFGTLLAKFLIWTYRLWKKPKDIITQAYTRHLKQVGYEKFETKEGVKVSQGVVLVISLIALILLTIIFILALLRVYS